MIKKLVIFISLVSLYSCTKDKGIVPKPNVTETPAPVIKFVFVNRIGLKNDSVGNGNIDTVFQSLCTKVKYYYKERIPYRIFKKMNYVMLITMIMLVIL